MYLKVEYYIKHMNFCKSMLSYIYRVCFLLFYVRISSPVNATTIILRNYERCVQRPRVQPAILRSTNIFPIPTKHKELEKKIK